MHAAGFFWGGAFFFTCHALFELWEIHAAVLTGLRYLCAVDLCRWRESVCKCVCLGGGRGGMDGGRGGIEKGMGGKEGGREGGREGGWGGREAGGEEGRGGAERDLRIHQATGPKN
jgi:hypothetical protein